MRVLTGHREKMFKSRIKCWSLDKKNKHSEVQEILRQFAIRKSLGKESVFVLRGRPVDIADVERYARRKRLTVTSNEAAQTSSETIPDLICFTPPPTPLSLHVPILLQNVHCFLNFSNAFVEGSLQSRSWDINHDAIPIVWACDPRYPANVYNGFFSSIKDGIRWYDLGAMTQAYSLWRSAFSQLELSICSSNPSRLICLIQTIAVLAECENDVAALLLRYLGDLVNSDRACSDTRLAMLQSLGRMEVKDLPEITKTFYNCYQEAFYNHFNGSFFQLGPPEVLSMLAFGQEWDFNSTMTRLNYLILGSGTYDDFVSLSRAYLYLHRTMDLLTALEPHRAAGAITGVLMNETHHIPGGRMRHVQYDDVVKAIL